MIKAAGIRKWIVTGELSGVAQESNRKSEEGIVIPIALCWFIQICLKRVYGQARALQMSISTASQILTRNQGFMAHLIYLSALLKLESAPASPLGSRRGSGY